MSGFAASQPNTLQQAFPYCQSCYERSRKMVAVYKIVAGFPMCVACYNGKPNGNEEVLKEEWADDLEFMSNEIAKLRALVHRLAADVSFLKGQRVDEYMRDPTVNSIIGLPTLATIKQVVYQHFGFDPRGTHGLQDHIYVQIRHIAYVIAREHGYSYPLIGRAFGGKHHTTIIHGIRKMQNPSVEVAEHLRQIREKLKAAAA